MKRLCIYMFLLNLLMGVSQIVLWRMFQYEIERLESVIRLVHADRQQPPPGWCRTHILKPGSPGKWVKC